MNHHPQTFDNKHEARRVTIASSLGTLFEYFDFTLYSAASAFIFPKIFFPQSEPLVGVLASFAVFAVAFLARPVGGLLLSNYGDRIGRKPILLLTLSLMGVATLMVGVLPTYAQIGIWAPILLLIARLIQGLGAGAEYASGITMTAEAAPADRRGFYTSFGQAAQAAAFLLSTGMLLLLDAMLDEAQMLSWGWRLPFAASVVIFGITLFIRRNISESAEFTATREAQRATNTRPASPIKSVIKENRRAVVIGLLSGTGLNVGAYTITAFVLSYITNTIGLSRSIATTGLIIAAACTAVAIPLWGRLSDRVGARKVFMGGAVSLAVFAIPAFMLISTGSLPLIVIAMTIFYAGCTGAMLGSQAAFLTGIFATKHRLSGIAVSREFNAMLIGGPTPFIASALTAAAGGSPYLVAVFVICSALVTVVSLAFGRGLGGNLFEPRTSAGRAGRGAGETQSATALTAHID
jgi:MHS family shikimate/dehydroshikimate transporter-like MFS transporter